MIKSIGLFLIIFSIHTISAQIKLTHNIGENVIDTGMPSCEDDETWARVFNLSDFGIASYEQFIIKSAEVGIVKSDGGAYLGFSAFSIDSNFPDSYPKYLGGGGVTPLSQIDSPQIIQFDLYKPVIVPAGVERILVVIGKGDNIQNENSREVIIAGTAEDTGDSWYTGCSKYFTHTLTTDLDVPVPNANYFINAIGETFNTSSTGSVTTLNHNICQDLIKSEVYGCAWGGLSWSRDFILNDFGISTDEEFVINSGQVAIYYAGWGAKIQFRIYEIDDDFPDSFSDTNLIGSSQIVPVNYFSSLANNTKILNVEFDDPVIVPKEVKRVLVDVYQTDALMNPASTVQDNSTSWFRSYAGGCPPRERFADVNELRSNSNVKLFINVTGQVNNVNSSFGMNISNICSEFLKEFSLTNTAEISSVVWDFGDPPSGVDNSSTDLSPFHDFSEDGTYTITATVTGKNGTTEVITETINVKQPPEAYGINNIEACENSSGTGFSSSFDTSGITSQAVGNQTGDKVITYIDGSGNEYDELPNPFTNTLKNRETITVRVARNDELCCYSETSFDLIVNPLPDLSAVEDVLVCDTDNDGFSTFDLTEIHSNLSVSNTSIDFYFEDGQQISNTQLDEVRNNIKDQETLTVRVTNSTTNCYNETEFKIISSPSPTVNNLPELIGCDDNDDGISEYFDTSTIESQVLGNQTEMEVSYFDETGNQLPTPLPNPFTNTIANQETITVRVTNPQNGCYSETFLELRTSAQPQINQPPTLYACNDNNGISTFNTSTVESQIIGNQTGLSISYFDENGNELPNPLPTNFRNTKPWQQTILIKVENDSNSLCYSETSLNLIVNELPEINLKSDYYLCALEASLYLSTSSDYDNWLWTYENSNVISNSPVANLIDAGRYTLKVSKVKNGISCENSFSFNLVRSKLPKIEDIKIRDISANNYIEIITSGDGDFEYSIDGFNFQDDNIFNNLPGGIYKVQVRDKNGCGHDEKEVVLVDYPKVLTPNGDGFNDRWQIDGI